MKKQEKYVIIGGGISAVNAAAEIRRKDAESKIILISKDAVPPYKKYLLKNFIFGEKKIEELFIKDYDFYLKNNIHTRLNQKVIKIFPEENKLLLKHFEEIHYTKLLIATGAKPKIPQYLISYEKCFNFFNSFIHGVMLKNKISQFKNKKINIGIVCGDLAAYKVIKYLINNKKYNLTIFLNNESFWPLKLEKNDFEKIIKNFRKNKNLKIIFSDISKIKKINSNKLQIITEEGKSVIVDIFCGSFSLEPSLDFLIGSGIEFEKGILVDENFKTNITNIYAAGDCAQIYNPHTKDYFRSIGWKNALNYGKSAGSSITGKKSIFRLGGKSYFNIEGINFKTALWQNLEK